MDSDDMKIGSAYQFEDEDLSIEPVADDEWQFSRLDLPLVRHDNGKEQQPNFAVQGQTRSEIFLEALSTLMSNREDTAGKTIISSFAASKTITDRSLACVEGHNITLPGRIDILKMRNNLAHLRKMVLGFHAPNDYNILVDGCARLFLEKDPTRRFEYQHSSPSGSKPVFISSLSEDRTRIDFTSAPDGANNEDYVKLIAYEHDYCRSYVHRVDDKEHIYTRDYQIYLDGKRVHNASIGVCLNFLNCGSMPCDCRKSSFGVVTNIIYSSQQQAYEKEELTRDLMGKGKIRSESCYVRTRANKAVVRSRKLNKYKLLYKRVVCYAPLSLTAHCLHRSLYTHLGKSRNVSAPPDVKQLAKHYSTMTADELACVSRDILKDQGKDQLTKSVHLFALARAMGSKIEYCALCNVAFSTDQAEMHRAGNRHKTQLGLIKKKEARLDQVMKSYQDEREHDDGDDDNDGSAESGEDEDKFSKHEQAVRRSRPKTKLKPPVQAKSVTYDSGMFTLAEYANLVGNGCEGGHPGECMLCKAFALTRLPCCYGINVTLCPECEPKVKTLYPDNLGSIGLTKQEVDYCFFPAYLGACRLDGLHNPPPDLFYCPDCANRKERYRRDSSQLRTLTVQLVKSYNEDMAEQDESEANEQNNA